MSAEPSRWIERALLALIVIIYLAVGASFAVRTPDWQNPDEPAHYNYIAQVSAEGCCPLIQDGDWDQAYLEEIKAARFAPETLGQMERVRYENHQPPLYYVLAAPVFSITSGDITALRLLSVAIGTIIVLCAYGVGKIMFPSRPEIGLSAGAFVAFLPQHVAFLASVNNDSLAWSIVALGFLASVAYVKGNEQVKPWMLGLLVGVGFVTKATTYFMAGVVVLAILLHWWERHREADVAPLPVGPLLQFLVPALALGALWWLRNIGVYGFPDFLGLAAHDAVVIGQPRTADEIARVGWGAYLSTGLQTTFNSFWGQFGWMALPLVGGAVAWIYPAIAILLVLALVGVFIDLTVMQPRGQEIPGIGQRSAWILLIVTALFSVLMYLYYNTEFLQLQGRYMFTLLIPLGIWLALGLDAWRRLLLGRWSVTRWLTPLVFLLFAPLDMWLLWTVIVPNLA